MVIRKSIEVVMQLTATHDIVRSVFEDGARMLNMLQDQCVEQIVQASEILCECLKKGGKILFCGNGGSAADAQHLSAEFIGRCTKERNPLAAIALSADTSALTAIGNDYGFEQIFSRQVQALARPDDCLIAISTSGNSPNVVNAVKAARELQVFTLGLTGCDKNALCELADMAIRVPSRDTQRIQEGHIAIGHILCQLVETALFLELSGKEP
jgi:D-sedoheptulose 7-phosphate isomerase